MTSSHETPKEAARRLSAKIIKEGYKPEALHVYTDRDANPLYWRIRLKHPETGEKWIRPMSISEKGFTLDEPKFQNGKPLYRLNELFSRPNDPIILFEGEPCVDAAAKLGILASTSGSTTSASKADWGPCIGHSVKIWPDNDEAGFRYAAEAKQRLRALGCSVQIIDIKELNLPPKGDIVDWLKVHLTSTASDIQSLPVIKDEIAASVDDDEVSQSQATALVKFVEANAELFHDQNGDVYAQDKITHETRRIDGRQFRDWLSASFYKSTSKPLRDQSLRESLSTLSGLGRYRGECRDVNVRVAVHEGCYFIDLAEPGQSRAICLKAGDWMIVDNPPVMFTRPVTMRPLPTPERGGNIDLLWQIVNIPNEARLLVLAWLGECWRPDTPFPLLELIGEQGSAKSTTQTVLRQLIDPNASNLRAAPKTIEDIFVSAGASWLVSYENISHMSAAMQDALCILATGGGFAKRKLYSDADESVITVNRPVVLNGITAAVTAQDLIDRTLSIETPTILARSDMTDLRRTFELLHGKLLGALLDIIAIALAKLPAINIPVADRPRLVEFARFGMAIAEAMGEPASAFMTQFNVSRLEAISRTIDASPVATAVIEWLEFNPQGRRAPAKVFMHEMEKYRPDKCDAWPRTPKGFADALRRAAPSLRQMGIECRSLPKTGGFILWEIKPRVNLSTPCPASPACLAEGNGEQDIRTFRTSPRELFSEEIEERSAILEFDSGLNRAEADRQANLLVSHHEGIKYEA